MDKTFKEKLNGNLFNDLSTDENCMSLDNIELNSKSLLENLCDDLEDSAAIEEDTESCNGSHNQYWKTKLCLMFSKGICKNGENCRFAHGNDELRSPVNLKKTKLCPFWLNSSCSTGENCPFAHGTSELRVTDDFYKTSVCRYWRMGVKCDAGILCRHAHGETELRKKPKKHTIRKKDCSLNNDLKFNGNKFNEDCFLLQVPPPPSFSSKDTNNLKFNDNFVEFSNKNKKIESISTDLPLGFDCETKIRRNYTCDNIIKNNQFNPSFENWNNKNSCGITRNSISMQSLSDWNNLKSRFGNNREILLNSNSISNVNYFTNNNLFLKTETGFDKTRNFLSNNLFVKRIDDTEKQYIEQKSTETDISSFCSLKRVENSSNSLASNISDMSLTEDCFGNNWQGKFQNQQFLKYPQSSLFNLFPSNYDGNNARIKVSNSVNNLSGEMKIEDIKDIDYLKNISEISSPEDYNSNCNHSTVSTSLEGNLPILVKIKLLDSSEVSSLSIGEVPAILIPSEDMKSAKVHFLSV